MRLATVKTRTGTTAAVEYEGAWRALPAEDLGTLLQHPHWRDSAASAPANSELPPPTFAQLVTAPRKVLCCGLNYAGHIEELGRELPDYPTLFAKYADTLTGPASDIVLDGSSSQVDWEAELAVVVGTEVRHADEAEAAAAIAGYTVANDVSMRDWQNRTAQWLQGKAFDATTPLGPVMVTADACDPEAGLEITCSVNGEEVQHANTSGLVFSAAKLVSYVSRFTALRPGDLVLTGTPGGVGMGRKPPRYLADGDEMVTSVEGIGELRNRIRFRGAAGGSGSA